MTRVWVVALPAPARAAVRSRVSTLAKMVARSGVTFTSPWPTATMAGGGWGATVCAAAGAASSRDAKRAVVRMGGSVKLCDRVGAADARAWETRGVRNLAHHEELRTSGPSALGPRPTVLGPRPSALGHRTAYAAWRPCTPFAPRGSPGAGRGPKAEG